MFQNYLKSALRNMLVNKTHSFINIAGLSVGMAVVILIGLWIWDELSFDRYHTNYDRIAKVRQHVPVNGVVETWKNVPYPLADELRNHYGDNFKYIVRSSNSAGHILTTTTKQFNKHGVFFEPEAPYMLSLNMLKGSRAGLQDPSSILLSASLARIYFGDTDPMNQVMHIDNKTEVKVTGVYEDLPANSTFANITFIAPFQLYVNNSSWIQRAEQNWNSNSVQIYVQLADKADIKSITAGIKDITLNKVKDIDTRYKPALFLDPMHDWHLYQEFENGVNVGGRIQYVWLFGIIGIFVLILACINFMNLSTARSQKRAREVGVRKAIGSGRKHLIWQFFCESLLVVTFAFGCALVIVQISLPFFNEIAVKKMTVLWGNTFFWVAGIGFTALTGLIAGSYPALYLSSFKPVKVLKGALQPGRFAALPRKVLVVVQFTVSVTLIICTIIVFRQIQFAKNRAPGYNRNGLIVLPMQGTSIPEHFETVSDELLQTGAVTAMASSESTATDVWGSDGGFNWKGKDPSLAVDFPNTGVSFDYGKTVSWQFVEGRDFSRAFPSDSTAFVINEAAVRFMGLKKPVGETIELNNRFYTVIGIIKDVITESPYEPVRPSVYCMNRGNNNFAIARLNPSISTGKALSIIESVFHKYSPATPFDYKFADAEYQKKFSTEERIGKLASVFAVLAIFISCLGLFGMASFMAEQRTKEIGVRKVLGATVFNLWRLLSQDFVLLIIIALLVAIPVSWCIMHNWLQGYQYRANISWWIFATAGAGALFITIFTVSFQAVKAAMANPVKSLKAE